LAATALTSAVVLAAPWPGQQNGTGQAFRKRYRGTGVSPDPRTMSRVPIMTRRASTSALTEPNPLF